MVEEGTKVVVRHGLMISRVKGVAKNSVVDNPFDNIAFRVI